MKSWKSLVLWLGIVLFPVATVASSTVIPRTLPKTGGGSPLTLVLVLCGLYVLFDLQKG